MSSHRTSTSSNGKLLPKAKPAPITKKTAGSLRERSAAFCKNIGLKGVSFILRSIHRDSSEQRKVIVKSGAWTAFNRCWVHIIPVCATAVLGYLNIAGFYIGGNLEGPQGGAFTLPAKLLALQSTAKLLELLIVASLGTILLDIFRNEMMYGKDGVPLGMLGVDMKFQNISYFWSPEFWASRRAFASRRKRWLITIMLLLCGALALLAGPSSALLLIPVYRGAWPAGGTDFYLAGDRNSLWPETLDANAVGSTETISCVDPSPDAINAQLISSSGCIWNGYQTFVSTFRELHQTHMINITVTDGAVTRILQCNALQVDEPFTLAPNVAAASPSGDLAGAYITSIQALKGVSSYAHYRWLPFGLTVRVSGYIPSVRTQCVYNANFTFPDSNAWEYPFLPASGPPKDFSYSLAGGTLLNSTITAMEWRPIPTGPSNTTDGATTAYYPSALLNLQIPQNGSHAGGAVYTCSVDARWVRADTMGANYDSDVPGKYYVYGEDLRQTPYFPYAATYLPAHGGALQIDLDWLNTLTPSINPTIPGYTTLAAIFEATLIDDAFTAQLPLLPSTESIIATIVADGMSRIGYAVNGGNITLAGDAATFLTRYNMSPANFYNTVYKGTASLPPPAGYSAHTATPLRWTVAIPGYVYSADGAAYYLALLVLFAHAALALAHVFWTVVVRRTSSDAWDSLAELLVLAVNSRVEPGVLGGTCAGVMLAGTMRRVGRVRVVDRDAGGGEEGYEQVQLLFGDGESGKEGGGCTTRVGVDVAYGAA